MIKFNLRKNRKISLIKQSLIIFVSLVISVAVPIQTTRNALADQYDDKIALLQKDIEAYQAEGARLNSEAATLQSTIAQLANEEAVITTQISISQAKYDQLVQQIADTEKSIKDNQDALGTTIADIYVDSGITPIEMFASSKNISDYLDKQEYQSSIRSELTSTISRIKSLKAQLDQQKTDVAKVLDDQKSQQTTLVAKKNEQQNLLDQTQGKEANYQRLISDSQSQIAEAKATQAIINARINSSGGYVLVDSGSLTDYPWNDSNCPMSWYYSTGGSDGNGGDGHGYGCRQCASYVAWRFAKETGIYPSWGDAVNFTNGATSLGYHEGGAQRGSIAVMDPAKAGQSHGHVAWVESDPVVDSSGRTVILVSQYNYDFGWGYGYYSSMWLSVNAFDHYIHIK